MSFQEKLRKASESNDSIVCVGLDTDHSKIPPHIAGDTDAVLGFNKAIIDATKDNVCAYKPNSAFYEALGSHGIDMLVRTCEMVPPDIPVILDVKRGDIGSTAEKYAAYAYDIVGADAVTVNPYMGFDAVRPFLRDNVCIFILCLTSNPSADEFQMCETPDGLLFEIVARKAAEWSKYGEVGIVAGATRPDYLGRIREIVGDVPFLIPGVGAQGGSAAEVIGECGGKAGSTVINSSRGIIYASSGENFAEEARRSLVTLNAEINSYRRREE